jgi:predicted regulator of Ras-like GTPase activity (Roadblock/LC7/MglB family)
VVLEEAKAKPKSPVAVQKEVPAKSDPAPAASKGLAQEKIDQLKGVLAELNAVSGIMRCFLIGKDGIIVVSMGESSNNADLGKQALAIFDNTRRSVTRLDQGKLLQIFVTAESGNILLVSFENHVLIVLANNKINLGLLRLSLDSAVKKLDALLA